MSISLSIEMIGFSLLIVVSLTVLVSQKLHRVKVDEHNLTEEFAACVLNNLSKQVCFLDHQGKLIKSNSKWDQFAESVCQYTSLSAQKTFQSLFDLVSFIDDKGATEIKTGFTNLVNNEAEEFSSRYSVAFKHETRHMEIRIKKLPNERIIIFQSDRTDNWIDENRFRAAKREAAAMAMQLETNQRSLELAIQGGRLAIWHWDVATGYFDLSHDWYRLMGCPELALQSSIESLRSLLHEEDQEQWSFDRIMLLSHGESFDCQFRIRRPNGKYVWVQALGSVNQYREDGLPESLSGVLIDINDRKRAELKDMGMARIIEDSLNEVYVIDAERLVFLEVNRGARENLGYSLDELKEMSPEQTTGGNKEELQTMINTLVEGKTDRIECETVHVRKDGSSYPFLLTLQLAEYDQREVFVAIGTDITKRKELEQRLSQTNKLESIGQLAAGVAHEINTPLQCVGMNVRFLSETTNEVLSAFDKVHDCLKEIDSSEDATKTKLELADLLNNSETTLACQEIPQAIEDSSEAINRVLKIIHAMKELSHPGEDKMVSCDLNHLLESTVAVTQNRWKNHATLALDLCPELNLIECDSGTMNQVFVNLLVNASDAIESRNQEEEISDFGTITLRTENHGDYVVIEVEDNGCGMDKDTIRRVFEPFFTTKEIGAGTGQGLALCHQIVTQQHRGQISVHSEPSKGTRIRIKIAARVSDRPANETSQKTAIAKTASRLINS